MLRDLLIELKMAGALLVYEKLCQTVKDKERLMLELLAAECRYRQDRAVRWRFKQAHFPVEKEWEEVDAALNPKIDFERVRRYSDGQFVEQKRNLCLIGAQGTGKTHCLVALGRELCRKGKTVRFYTACELVNAMEEAKSHLKLSQLMKSLLNPKLLIIDELGFIPFSENGARLLFDVFASRYERGSIAVSTNLSLDKWMEIFGSLELTAALIDRFAHRADIIPFDGQSVRLLQAKKAKASKDKMPIADGIHLTP